MNHKKFRTKKKQKGGSDTDRIEPQDLNNLTDHVNKRMSFLPQQDNLGQFNDINIKNPEVIKNDKKSQTLLDFN